MTFKITVKPNTFPVGLEEIRQWVHIIDPSINIYNDMLALLVESAASHAERYMNRAICTQTCEVYVDKQELSVSRGTVDLPWGTVQRILEVVQVKEDGSEVIVPQSNYRFRPSEDISLLSVPTGEDVRIKYIAGWGTTQSNIPQAIQLAVKQLAATSYALRQDQVAGGTLSTEAVYSANRILEPYRIWL
jgi:uncharacterized phiE125 gp8 family phage protein